MQGCFARRGISTVARHNSKNHMNLLIVAPVAGLGIQALENAQKPVVTVVKVLRQVRSSPIYTSRMRIRIRGRLVFVYNIAHYLLDLT